MWFEPPTRAVVLVQKANQELLDRVLRDVWKLHGKPMAQALVRAVADLLDDVTLTKLAAALQTGSVQRVLDVIPWKDLEPALAEEFTALRFSYELGGKRAAAAYGATFAVTTQDVIRWTLANGNALPRFMEAHKADAMREILRHAALRGYSPRRVASLLLKGDLVALTPRDVNAVFNFLRRQQEAKVPIGVADQRAIAYSRRLLRARALLIAENELNRAAIAGAVEAWHQLQEEGLISRQAYLEWVCRHEGEFPCERCEHYEGATVPLGSRFGSGVMPPLHPRCRCILVLHDPAPPRRR